MDSLVKGSKSPTSRENVQSVGTAARLLYRPWSGEWRVLLHTQVPTCGAPPQQAGDRYTARLTDRGAREITDAGRYVALRGGFNTFLTLTLDERARRDIEARRAVRDVRSGIGGERVGIERAPGKVISYQVSKAAAQYSRLAGAGDPVAGIEGAAPFTRVNFPWVSSMQKEASRFFDAAQKMFRRGWTTSTGERVAGSDAPLDYVWIGECPKNAEGEDNPHIHVLMRWRVEFRYFKEWSARLEKLWGQGFAHLERIRCKESASTYLLKAVGYLIKGKGADQGRIRGNRYGISKSARAPGWDAKLSWDEGVLQSLFNEARDLVSSAAAPHKARRRAAVENISKLNKGRATARAKKKLKGVIAAAREKISAIGLYVGRRQVIAANYQKLTKFFVWCRRAGWPGFKQRPPGHWITEFLRRQQWRLGRRVLDAIEFTEECWDSLMRDARQFEPMGRGEYEHDDAACAA